MKNYSKKTNKSLTRYRTPSSFRVRKPLMQRSLKVWTKNGNIKSQEH